MEDPIDLLEKRIQQLELQVLPKDNAQDITEIAKKTSIVNLCFDTHTMIQTALSCRDVIGTVIKKVEVINSLLDPITYIDSNYLSDQDGLDDETRKKYAVELYKEVKNITEMIKTFDGLKVYADSDLSKVTESFVQLQAIYDKNANLYEECRTVTKNVLQAIEGYNIICRDIALVFAKLEDELSMIEESLNKKPPIDE